MDEKQKARMTIVDEEETRLLIDTTKIGSQRTCTYFNFYGVLRAAP
jgi:hypothetical protein